MSTNRTRRISWWMAGVGSAALACAGLSLGAGQQPPAEGGKPSSEGGAGARATEGAQKDDQDVRRERSRAALRKYIEDRLDRTRKLAGRLEEDQRKLEAELAKLDQGGDPEAARQKLDTLPEMGWRQRIADGNQRNSEGGEGRRRERGPGGPGNPGGPGGFGTGEGLIGLEREPVRPLTPQERDEIIVVIRERDAETGAKFDALRVKSVELFEKTVDSVAPRVRMLREAHDRGDEELAALRLGDIRNTIDLFGAALAMKDARSDRQKTDTQEEMRAVLGRQFDTRIKIREREIEHFLKRIEAMRKELVRLKEQRDDIIGKWDLTRSLLAPGGGVTRPKRGEGKPVENPPPLEKSPPHDGR